AHELTHVVQQSGPTANASHMNTATAPLVQRKGIGELWQEHVSEPYGNLKESAYQGLIDAVRKAQNTAFNEVRTAAALMPPGGREVASTLITIYEVMVNILWSAVYAIIGLIVGAGEAIVGMVKGLVQLLYTVGDLLIRFVYGFIDGGAAFDESAGELLTALKGMPA